MQFTTRITLIVTICLFLITGSVYCQAQNAPDPFNKTELDTFCGDIPKVFKSLNEEEREQYLFEVINDYTNTVFSREPDREFPANLTADRFNYILNHTILAGVIEDMGGFGEKKIRFLKKQKTRIEKSSDLPAGEKERIINELDESIHQVTRLQKQSKAIPWAELILLWDRKTVLNDMLLGVVPLRKKKMAAH